MIAPLKGLDQKGGGGFPAIEPRIVLFLLMMAGSIFALNLHRGFWPALFQAVEVTGGIVLGFFLLITLLVIFGKLGQGVSRLFHRAHPRKDPGPDPGSPNKDPQ